MGPVSHNTSRPMSTNALLQKMQYLDEVWANLGLRETEIDQVSPEESQNASNYGHHKRLRTPELDLGTEPSRWMAKSEDPRTADPLNMRHIKRRRITIDGEPITRSGDIGGTVAKSDPPYSPTIMDPTSGPTESTTRLK